MIQSDKELAQRADNNQYTDNELTELKIPLHLPYMTSSSGYERIDGAVNINGIYYNYVKRKVYNDTLYLLCIPNKKKNSFYAARNDYAKSVQDVPVNGKNAATSVKKLPLANEYNQSAIQFSLPIPCLIINQPGELADASVLSSFLNKTFHPPQVTRS